MFGHLYVNVETVFASVILVFYSMKLNVILILFCALESKLLCSVYFCYKLFYVCNILFVILIFYAFVLILLLFPLLFARPEHTVFDFFKTV